MIRQWSDFENGASPGGGEASMEVSDLDVVAYRTVFNMPWLLVIHILPTYDLDARFLWLHGILIVLLHGSIPVLTHQVCFPCRLRHRFPGLRHTGFGGMRNEAQANITVTCGVLC